MRRKFLLIILLFLLVASVARPEDTDELAGVYYQSGLALARQNKYEEAMGKFYKALSYRRNWPEALFRLGECQEKAKAARQALKNYRLCRKYLSEQAELSTEQQELTASVNRVLERLDAGGKQLRAIRNKYIADLVALATTCIGRRHYRFACGLLEYILEMDPDNKQAQELLNKTRKSIPSDAPTRLAGKHNIFNGRDIKNWEYVGGTEINCWTVERGNLIAEPKSDEGMAGLKYKGKVSANFRFTAQFSIDQLNSGCEVLVIIGVNKNDPTNHSTVRLRNSLRTNSANNFVMAKQGNRMKMSFNGKAISEIEYPNDMSPAVGLIARKLRATFTNVTLEEIK